MLAATPRASWPLPPSVRRLCCSNTSAALPPPPSGLFRHLRRSTPRESRSQGVPAAHQGSIIGLLIGSRISPELQLKSSGPDHSACVSWSSLWQMSGLRVSYALAKVWRKTLESNFLHHCSAVLGVEFSQTLV